MQFLHYFSYFCGFYLINIFPISTSGIIEMLVASTNAHWVRVSVVSPKSEDSTGTKYTPKMSPNSIKKLKLKKWFLKIFILNMLRSDLQFIACMICIKQIVKKDIVLATAFP